MTSLVSFSTQYLTFRNSFYVLQVVLQPHRSAKDLYGNSNQGDGLVQFGEDVRPICTLPQSDYPLNKLTQYHCEISGWGMTEYNNSNSYPDSVRAARITVGDVSETFCNYLYKYVQYIYCIFFITFYLRFGWTGDIYNNCFASQILFTWNQFWLPNWKERNTHVDNYTSQSDFEFFKIDFTESLLSQLDSLNFISTCIFQYFFQT